MNSQKATGTNTNIILNRGSKGFKKWNGDNWEQVTLAESAKEIDMEEEQDEKDDEGEGLPLKVLKFMGLPKSYRKTLYQEFVHDVAQIPTETASSFNNIVKWICGDGEGEIEMAPSTASSVGEGDVGGHVERLQIVTTSSNESVGSQKAIRILLTDSASNMNIVTPFGILISDDQKQREAEQPQHYQLVEAMEVQIPNNMIKIAPSMHGLKFEEHDKGDIKTTEALFHKTLLVEEQPSEMGDIKISNSDFLFRQPSKLEINSNEMGDTKVSKAIFRTPSKHVCLSETSIYCYQKSDTEEEVESRQVVVEKTSLTEEKAKLKVDMNNNNNHRHVCTSETSIYCYGVSESENEGEFTDALNDEEQKKNETEEVKRVTFASPSETNIYAYQDYEEEDEEENEQEKAVDCEQIEVNDHKESQETIGEANSENRFEECKEDYHQEGQASEKESGTDGEYESQGEEANKSQGRPRKTQKIRERKIQNKVLAQIKQILEENNKVSQSKKEYSNVLVQTNETPREDQQINQEHQIFHDALVQNEDIGPDSHPIKEDKIPLVPRPNPVSIMKTTSRGNNSSKTSIQFNLPHQVASFSSHDIFQRAQENPQEYCVGMVQTDVVPLERFNFNEQQIPVENFEMKEEQSSHDKMHMEESPRIQAEKVLNEFLQQMNEIPGEHKNYNFEALEQAKENRGFTPPQQILQETMKEEAPIHSSSCAANTTVKAVEKEKFPPSNTTSEVQMQLNSDLKTLEDIVKKLYKNLNKKGPLTLVANFKPKQNGELVLDMGPLTGRQKKEVSFSSALNGDDNSPDTSKLKVDENKHEEVTEEPVKCEIRRNTDKNAATQVHSGRGSLNLTNPKPPSHPTAATRQNPVSIMKTSHTVNSSKSSHQPSNAQANFPIIQKSSVMISLQNGGSSCSMRSDGSKTNVDMNSNIEIQTPPPSPKSALKQSPSKMPLLRPAKSSHSMLKTCIETETPSSTSKKENEVVSTPPRPKTSRSKHYILQPSPDSDHRIVEQPKKNPTNTYKLVEGSNSKHYLVPVQSQHQQPKQVIVTASRSRSNTNTNIRSQSQHVLIPAPRRNQSQHLLSQPSPSKSILREPSIRSKSSQLADAILPSGSHSQHVMMENPHYFNHHPIEEPPRPKTVRHVLVHPPSTCQNPHLHPRTATIVSPPSSQHLTHPRTCTAPAFPSRYGGYRIVQPCSMHQNHPQQLSHPPSNRRIQDYSTAEETASNTSMISSTSARTENENNLSAPSDAEEGQHFHSPSNFHQSRHDWQPQQSRSLAPSISPSVRVHVQNPAQSPNKTLTSSPSSTKQQYRTTIRIPPGPSKSTHREFEDSLSAPSDADTPAEDHVELRNFPSRSRPSCHNWQQQNQQSRLPVSSNTPSVRVQVQNPTRSSTNIVNPSSSATNQQYRATISIPSRHSKLGDSGGEDNLSAPSDNDNMAQVRVKPSRSRSSCHNWQQHSRPQPPSISPSVKVQARNIPRSSSKTIASTKEQYRTTLHIPTGPPKPSSYSAIFKEKQQKQKQTFYVDLTSNGNRKNNR